MKDAQSKVKWGGGGNGGSHGVNGGSMAPQAHTPHIYATDSYYYYLQALLVNVLEGAVVHCEALRGGEAVLRGHRSAVHVFGLALHLLRGQLVHAVELPSWNKAKHGQWFI